jgi:hypothetical protein
MFIIGLAVPGKEKLDYISRAPVVCGYRYRPKITFLDLVQRLKQRRCQERVEMLTDG